MMNINSMAMPHALELRQGIKKKERKITDELYNSSSVVQSFIHSRAVAGGVYVVHLTKTPKNKKT